MADVIKSLDTVDRGILDCALGRLGLPGWLRKVYFAHHTRVRLRFKLAAGLGEAWTRDGGKSLQGCPLSMVFSVALYGPWRRYLVDQHGVTPSCMLITLNVLLLMTERFSWRPASLTSMSG